VWAGRKRDLAGSCKGLHVALDRADAQPNSEQNHEGQLDKSANFHRRNPKWYFGLWAPAFKDFLIKIPAFAWKLSTFCRAVRI
jgi:hypothetical protein